MALFPPTRRPTVDLVVFGDEPAEMVPIARRTLREHFGVDPGVRRIEPIERHTERTVLPGMDEATHYPATDLLEPTADASEADREIGLVADPLVLDGNPRIFGVALVGDSSAVITSDPLGETGDRFESRVEKQVIKQLGHLFGIEKTHEGCVFEEASTAASLDATPSTFCDPCRARLTEPATSPKPPHWFVSGTRVYREIVGGDAEDQTADDADDAATDVTNPRTSDGAVGVGRAGASTATSSSSVADRTPTDESMLPAGLRRPVHGLYRYGRVWALIIGFGIAGLLGLLVELELYRRLVGTDPSNGVVWGMLVGAVVLGYYGQLTARRWAGRGWRRLFG